MKQKYRFTLHFFRISEKEEENKKVEVILKEYQTFSKSFWEYCFYYKFAPESVHGELHAALAPEIQEHLKNKELLSYLNSIKLARAKDAFFSIIEVYL